MDQLCSCEESINYALVVRLNSSCPQDAGAVSSSHFLNYISFPFLLPVLQFPEELPTSAGQPWRSSCRRWCELRNSDHRKGSQKPKS